MIHSQSVNAHLSYRALWKIPHLVELIAAMALSRLAERMFSLMLILFVLARFHSPSLAGWITFAAVAPGLIVSPIAGAILDRTGPMYRSTDMRQRVALVDYAASLNSMAFGYARLCWSVRI